MFNLPTLNYIICFEYTLPVLFHKPQIQCTMQLTEFVKVFTYGVELKLTGEGLKGDSKHINKFPIYRNFQLFILNTKNNLNSLFL